MTKEDQELHSLKVVLTVVGFTFGAIVLIVIVLVFVIFRLMTYCEDYAAKASAGLSTMTFLEPTDEEIKYNNHLSKTDRITPYYRELLRCKREGRFIKY